MRWNAHQVSEWRKGNDNWRNVHHGSANLSIDWLTQPVSHPCRFDQNWQPTERDRREAEEIVEEREMVGVLIITLATLVIFAFFYVAGQFLWWIFRR